MRIPVIRGVIDRRILANFRVAPEAMARVLPSPFRPKLAGGYAIGGICLIRLKALRPRFVPLPWGLGSENAAHRVAVEWDAEGRVHEGVYVPRRDTSSRLNTFAGGTLFPGEHHHARFNVEEKDRQFRVEMRSDDRQARVLVSGHTAEKIPENSVFASLAEASDFFERGSLGYSNTHDADRYDGLELRCDSWRVEPLEIDAIESIYFQDASQFPRGAVEFDCALLMREITHEWHGRADLCCSPAAQTAYQNFTKRSDMPAPP